MLSQALYCQRKQAEYFRSLAVEAGDKGPLSRDSSLLAKEGYSPSERIGVDRPPCLRNNRLIRYILSTYKCRAGELRFGPLFGTNPVHGRLLGTVQNPIPLLCRVFGGGQDHLT